MEELFKKLLGEKKPEAGHPGRRLLLAKLFGLKPTCVICPEAGEAESSLRIWGGPPGFKQFRIDFGHRTRQTIFFNCGRPFWTRERPTEVE